MWSQLRRLTSGANRIYTHEGSNKQGISNPVHTFYLGLEEGRIRILSGRGEMEKWCARQREQLEAQTGKNDSDMCKHASVAERVKSGG